MRWPWARLLPAVVLLLTVTSVAPLAEASPPDPTWIAGLYDNGDSDDAIMAITSAAAVVVAPAAEGAAPTLVVIGSIRDSRAPLAPPRAQFAHQPRSPPAR